MVIAEATQEKTGLGNYFIANYPPFSFWKPTHLAEAQAALHAPPREGVPLGLYLHIPFCRKRCKFCYFRVYTDKNSRDVESYLTALTKEVSLYSRLPMIGSRPLKFIYFGGGTPSFLSATQLRGLMTKLKEILPWEGVEEVTFECEPGTLQQHKLAALKELGVTRLSLGIENFSDKILEENGRAHLSHEIYQAYGWARDLAFDQINIDLISGMVGETWDNWKECVKKTLELSPDSVTIYQMELPFNTVYSKELRVLGQDETQAVAIADWPTKRDWVRYAFEEMVKSGYRVSSAYTVVKKDKPCRFVYRDSLWHGADMLGTGVASFGHVSGVHVQNVDTWEQYLAMLDRNELPLARALPVKQRELMIREMILQLKTGRLTADYFQHKFGAEVVRDYQAVWESLRDRDWLTFSSSEVRLNSEGLLHVDRFLPEFFLPEHRGARYT